MKVYAGWELKLTLNSDKSFAPLPTYPVVLQLKGDDQDVNLFSERVKGRPIPGMPRLDPNRIVRNILLRNHTLLTGT